MSAAQRSAQVWQWLAEVADPEIPVISVVDLGIVRAVDVYQNEAKDWGCRVTVTPTYSGCPATEVIASSIQAALQAKGLQSVSVVNQIAPAWTTAWLSEAGKQKLKDYGIAVPNCGAQKSASQENAAGSVTCVSIDSIRRARTMAVDVVDCPRCQSSKTERLSQFGSTPCKAQYRCLSCLEPFDFFKPH